MSQSRALANAMFPDVPGPWLELANSFLAWVFLADDELERCADEREAGLCAAAIIAPAEPSATASRAEWAKVLLRLSAFGSRRRHAASFLTHVHEFLDGCVWEAANRWRQSPPPLQSYRRMRPHTGATWSLLRIALAAGDVSLDAEHHPLTQRVLAKAVWLPCLANDLVSVEKELAAGDFHNAVILHMRETGTSVGEARRAFAMEYERTRTAFDDELASADLPLDLEQRRLITNLVTGADRWQAESARYRIAPA